jgi:hypothetical protein
MGPRRGQNSLEFMVLFGFLFIVFIGFTFVIQGKIREQLLANQQDQYVQLADKIEKEFLLASRVNTGYMRAFDLPLTLNGESYTATLEDVDTLVIKGSSSNNEYLRFLSANVTMANPAWKALNATVIVSKNDSGIFVRNDCASLAACS